MSDHSAISVSRGIETPKARSDDIGMAGKACLKRPEWGTKWTTGRPRCFREVADEALRTLQWTSSVRTVLCFGTLGSTTGPETAGARISTLKPLDRVRGLQGRGMGGYIIHPVRPRLSAERRALESANHRNESTADS